MIKIHPKKVNGSVLIPLEEWDLFYRKLESLKDVQVIDEQPELNQIELRELDGILKQYANPALIKNETEIALKKAMRDKYGLS